MIPPDPPLHLLRDWAVNAERHWCRVPRPPRAGPTGSDRAGYGCYGSGYNAWGVQTNQKYLAALATLAVRGEGVAGLDRDWALDRALGALRFSLDSHRSGDGACTDGSQWGHTWISALGVERMMHGVYLLWPHLTEQDRADLRRVLVSECEWIMARFHRGQTAGVVAAVWDSSGKNAPESNLWNGALLWRTAAMFPDAPQAGAWRERAHTFLINSVSVATDAEDDALVAGRSVRERHVGANFFPNYALDHHGYLNVGYMVICVSNAAMLHFDCELAGLPRPETLDHHQADLWRLVRRLIFSDGRLARIGGDSRVRYAYCQEYLLPALLYAADRLGDVHAAGLAEAQLALIGTETAFNGDGSFFGRRLALLEARSPYYYTRLESDRACALSQCVVYGALIDARSPGLRAAPRVERDEAPGASPALPAAVEVDRSSGDPYEAPDPRRPTRERDFESSVGGSWHEPEHGAVLHRCPTRLAAFAWRAFGLAQGMCQPPDDGHLAEWESNLVGRVEFAADPHPQHPKPSPGRRLLGCHTDVFAGGFLTCGAVSEGAEVEIAEGWTGRDLASHHIAFAALPDGRTAVGLELARMAGGRGYLRSVCGLHLNIPNDLYNGFRRTLSLESGAMTLTGPSALDELLPLGSRWANLEGRVGAIGIYGAETLALRRSAARRGGAYASLYVEELCWSCRAGPWWADAGASLLDVGWAVLSGAGVQATRDFARDPRVAALPPVLPDVRGAFVFGADGRRYLVIANFGPCDAPVALPAFVARDEHLTDVATGERLAASPAVAGGRARLFVMAG